MKSKRLAIAASRGSLTEVRIISVHVVDLRFPTSRESIGSDAANKDPDYSAAYCILSTDSEFGLTFTLGRGTELCVMAVEYLAQFVRGRLLISITDNLAAFSRLLTDNSQFRWLGPEKGVIHMAAGALINNPFKHCAILDPTGRNKGNPIRSFLVDFLMLYQNHKPRRPCPGMRPPTQFPGAFANTRLRNSNHATFEYAVAAFDDNGERSKSFSATTDPANWRIWWPAGQDRQFKRPTGFWLPPYVPAYDDPSAEVSAMRFLKPRHARRRPQQ